MKRGKRYQKILSSVHHFLIFFMIVAFVITCCMLLFVTTMTSTMGITLKSDNIVTAAKLTFGNVILISFIMTVIDIVRRKLTVESPAKKITDASKKVMHGDFSVRIEPMRILDSEDRFNEIIECFNKMTEELSNTETLRTDFIANVSHELKTPLAVMQNYGTLLQEPGLSEEKRLEYSKAITDACRRLSLLITNILKLNKLENQQIFPTAESFNLGEQLCECLLGFEDIWEEKEIEIETDIEEDVFVRSDSEMLSLVWNNLFSNALKFTDAGGKVVLSLITDGEYAAVRVTDTGCGISREVGAHMFDKFYQGDTSHAGAGNGLGLALVKRVIDITESDISVESELGKGSTFTVRIRRVSDADAEEAVL